MKNIILQHWTGEMNELGTLSSANIAKYAEKVGAEYKLLRGNVFSPNLSAPCQKLYMLDKAFDEYDIVVMLDIDMFTRKGMEDNIFEDEKGVGMFTACQARLKNSIGRMHPNHSNTKYPYWGGAIYRLERDFRQKLRSHINTTELGRFSGQGRYEDEGIMHRLNMLADVISPDLSGDKKWCHGSFEEGIEQSSMIHIRTKIAPAGPKKPKIENLRGLIERGLIDK